MTPRTPAFRRGPKPWKITRTRHIASLGKLRLHEDRLVSDSGFRMMHPRLELQDFAIIVPVLDRDRLVFIWTYRPPIEAWELELPAGHVNDGEQPEACARRELEEETGYTARAWKRLGWLHSTPSISAQKAHVFLARGLRKGQVHREPYEKMGVRILKVSEAYQLLWSGRLRHSSSASALGLAQKSLDPAIPARK